MDRNQPAGKQRSKPNLPLTPGYEKIPPGKVEEEFSRELAEVNKRERKNAHYKQNRKK